MEEITEVEVITMTGADMAMTEDNYRKFEQILNTPDIRSWAKRNGLVYGSTRIQDFKDKDMRIVSCNLITPLDSPKQMAGTYLLLQQ
ncbi:hypothetical protein FCL47_12480 [Desulfopila sp. IMCC35006]|uniref:hypothetical protein n=1 Tax=Desulfopila sp. IMCC35006 TaxID=2569542 RepID=UPI0010AD0CB7|nr:hypothetical protein [Desulfopila sp. IMCC35006]TKB25901.1 hypothetical protein FCL47_12480 [Desulfopila sp. IMCC35006]